MLTEVFTAVYGQRLQDWPIENHRAVIQHFWECSAEACCCFCYCVYMHLLSSSDQSVSCVLEGNNTTTSPIQHGENKFYSWGSHMEILGTLSVSSSV